MKILIITLLIIWCNSLLACGDLSKKPSYMKFKEIKCGTILNTIYDVSFVVNGKSYPFGMNLGDTWGECPDPLRGCYRPYHNIQARGNAICKALGFGPYASTKDYGAFKRRPDLIASLERNSKGEFTPKIVSINHSRNDYVWSKSISCHRTYPKR